MLLENFSSYFYSQEYNSFNELFLSPVAEFLFRYLHLTWFPVDVMNILFKLLQRAFIYIISHFKLRKVISGVANVFTGFSFLLTF